MSGRVPLPLYTCTHLSVALQPLGYLCENTGGLLYALRSKAGSPKAYKCYSQANKMAQLAGCWASMGTSNHQNLHKSQAEQDTSGTPVLGVGERRSPVIHWPVYLVKSVSSRFTERCCLKREDGE